jgi:hypothetical protein
VVGSGVSGFVLQTGSLTGSRSRTRDERSKVAIDGGDPEVTRGEYGESETTEHELGGTGGLESGRSSGGRKSGTTEQELEGADGFLGSWRPSSVVQRSGAVVGSKAGSLAAGDNISEHLGSGINGSSRTSTVG